MQIFLFGSLDRTTSDTLPEGLRLLAARSDDPSKRWTTPIDDEGRFEVDAGTTDPFEGASDPRRVEFVLRVLMGPEVLSRTTTTIGVDEISPRASIPWAENVVHAEGLWVGGEVRTTRGDPIPETGVVVERVELGATTVLGRVRTNADGQWEMRVATEAAPLDLRVRVLDSDEATIASGSYASVRTELLANVVVPVEHRTSATRFELLRIRTREILGKHEGEGEQELPRLTSDDRGVLARRLGETQETIDAIVEDLEWTRRGAPRAAFFALTSDDLPMEASAVLALSTEDLELRLETAVSAATVSAWAEDLPRVVERLRQTAAAIELESETGQRRIAWLRDAGVEKQLAHDLMRATLLGQGDDDEPMWSSLERSHGRAAVASARFIGELQAIGIDHAPLIAQLDTQRRDARLATTRDLAALSIEQWEETFTESIDGRRIGAPDGVAHRSYARSVFRAIERRYPTLTVAHHWSRIGGRAELAEIARSHPDFDLGRTRIDAALSDGTLRLPEGSDAEKITAELRLVQRLFAMGPSGRRAEVIEALHGAGYRSAAEVAEHGALVLAERMKGRLHPSMLRQVLARARKKAAVVSALMVRHHPSLESTIVSGFVGTSTANLQTLFGPMGHCGCTHCRSVLSPAAYLADLLAFLRRVPIGGQTLLERLRTSKHREDIIQIELSCANTHTPMPYIDLVNERLEARLAPALALGRRTHQTTWNAEALRIYPEYLDHSVYEVLRDQAVHPWSLPFDLYTREVRAYLSVIDVSWAEVLATLAPQSPLRASTIGAERLGISEAQLRVIVGEHSASLEAMWGVGSLSTLESVPDLLDAAELDLDGLHELLATGWFQRPALTLTLASPLNLRVEFDDACQLEGARLEGLPTPSAWLWDRAHRFLRLARHSGWSLREVDLAILTIGKGALDQDTITAMGEVEMLRRRVTSISRDEILSWWGPIDTRRGYDDGAPSLFDRVFSDAMVGSPSTLTFTLDESREELRLADRDLSSDLPTIAAVFGIPQSRLRALLDEMVDPPTTLTVDSLSLLYRSISFARALRIPLLDLPAWMVALGRDPFSSPTAALRFIERHDRVRELGISIDELAYALGQASTEALGPQALEIWWARLLVALREADASALVPEATVLDRLHLHLVALLPPHAVALVEADVLGDAPQGLDPSAAATALETWLGAWIGGDTLTRASDPQTDRSALVQLLTDALAGPAQRARRRAAVITTLTSELRLPDDLASVLAAAIALHDSQLLEALIDPPTTTEAVAELLHGLRRWHRGAHFVRALGLGAETLAWVVEYGPSLGWLLPHALPETGTSPFAASALDRLVDFAWVLQRTNDDPTDLLRWLDAAQEGEPGGPLGPKRSAMLSGSFGWPAATTELFANHLGVSPTHVLDFSAIDRLGRALDLAERSNLDPTRLIAWASAGPDLATATEIRRTTTTRIDPVRRPAELGPLRDTIREQQRDALVARTLDLGPGGGGSAQIHAELLIDPEMSACRMASRIQEAIASVQLFVQRIQLGLEPNLEMPAELAPQWTWMRSYRIWEANRKVFLWPENWLDPQLRPDRSDLFDEALTTISGPELDDRRATLCVRGYLHGLRDIARLDVGGLCYEAEHDRLHVFARTRSTDGAWYSRRHERGVWTPWESVPVPIASTEVLPLIMRGQVVLAWPLMQSNADVAPDSNDEKPFTEVRLQWSFHDGGAWSEPRQTNADASLSDQNFSIIIGDSFVAPRIDDPRELSLEALHRGDTLLIVPLLRHGLAHATLGHFEADPCMDGFVARSSERDAFVAASPTGTGAVPLPRRTTTSRQSFERRGSALWDDSVRVPLRRSDGSYAMTPKLIRALGRYSINAPRQQEIAPDETWTPGFRSHEPFVLEDDARSFVVWPTRVAPQAEAGMPGGVGTESLRFRFELLQHPFVCELLEQEAVAGIHGMYRPKAEGKGAPLRRQLLEKVLDYEPHATLVEGSFPRLRFDFSVGGAYSEHNWELFLHLPLSIASRLSAAGRFADARRWLEHIFDPFGRDPNPGATDPAAQYWMIQPLWDAARTANVEHDLRLLNASDLTPDEIERKAELLAQIERWRVQPFEPHVIARLRPGAYQRQVVMRYLDTLIAWADTLFARGTTETIDEASQLYLLAAEILGPRPRPQPEGDVPARSFAQLADEQDEFSNFLVITENLVPLGEDEDDDDDLIIDDLSDGDDGVGELALGGLTTRIEPTHPLPPPLREAGDFGIETDPETPPPFPAVVWGRLVTLEQIRTPYFCIPPNETLLAYWDTVQDRLFKIRHCMDLRGGRRVPDLFAPPIDPGLLVEAVAQGIDLQTAIDDLYAPVPHYRFAVALRRAKELAAFVRELGRTLLAALERRDGEAFALMQGEQERFALEAVEQVRRAQIEEIEQQVAAIDRARALTEARSLYYETLDKEGLVDDETKQLEHLGEASRDERKAAKRRLAAGIVAGVPSLTLEHYSPTLPPRVRLTIGYGTANVVSAINAAADRFGSQARHSERRASRSGIDAQYARREEQWAFEYGQATLDLERIDTELLVAKARLQVAHRELEVHRRQVDNATQTRELLRSKYSQHELYEWMVGAVMQTYRQAFNLAVELSRKAERAYRYELADPSTSFVGGGAWEEHRRGLLAGERLALELERMESAYLDADRREHELVKRLSLEEIDPAALLALRYGRACEFEVGEELFAFDHPSHYLRRIRAVSVTVPSVSGPLVGINATLTLLRSAVRSSPTGWETEPAVDSSAGSESIALSTGQADGGVFEGGSDPRRRPFEGKGVVSRWRVELPELRQFDYRRIDDLVLEIRYTARDGGVGYAEATIVPGLLERLDARMSRLGTGWARSWSVRDDFPTVWQSLKLATGESVELPLDLEDSHFPFSPAGRRRRLRRVHLFVEGLAVADASVGVTMAVADDPGGGTPPDPIVTELSLISSSDFPGTHVGSVELMADAIGRLTLVDLDASATDVVVVVEYDFVEG